MTFTWPKAACFGLLLFLVSLVTISRSNNRAFGNDAIVFLQKNDPVPADAVLIRELRLSAQSYSDSCAWFELLLKGSRIAASSGANLVKIVERADHKQQGCDALELAIYRVDSPRNADRAFRWTPGRKLRWEDFQGGRRAEAGDHVAAETSCGINVETSLAPASAKARIYVFNTFDKKLSWVGPGQSSSEVLGHEQGHWDLCELYTRKMQARFDAMNISGARLNEVVNRVYEQVEREYIRRQEAYENETRHGIDRDAQQRWEQTIARELANG